MSSDATASDRAADAAAAAGGEDSDDEVALAQGARRMGAIGRNHLSTNPMMVKARVVRALKSREMEFMPHGQMASAIVR